MPSSVCLSVSHGSCKESPWQGSLSSWACADRPRKINLPVKLPPFSELQWSTPTLKIMCPSSGLIFLHLLISETFGHLEKFPPSLKKTSPPHPQSIQFCLQALCWDTATSVLESNHYCSKLVFKLCENLPVSFKNASFCKCCVHHQESQVILPQSSQSVTCH